jgi:hypothetical protein
MPEGRGIRNAFRILAENPESKRPIYKHNHNWEGNIEMNMKY